MNRRFAKDNCVRMVKKGVDAMSDEGSRVEGVNPACSKERAEGEYEAELPRAKPSGRSRRVIGCVARIACALVLGHVVFFLLSWTVPVVAGEVFNEVASIGLSALFFRMLHFRCWRFWTAAVLGVALWFVASVVPAYVGPDDPVVGRTRYYGLPFPARMVNECSSAFSSVADAKPGRNAINLFFWCYLVYASLVSPRIVRWLSGQWRARRRRLVVASGVLLALIALAFSFRHEIAVGWYAQREWQSPHGYKRLPRHLWPERTWWQDVLSYF